MGMKEALLARLVAAQPVNDLVGQRVHWVQRPQNGPLPAVVLQVISDPRPQHLKGFQPLRETRVQINCLGRTALEADAVTEAVIAAAVPEGTNGGIRFNRGMIDGGDSGGEVAGTIFIHRTRVDLIVWWSAED